MGLIRNRKPDGHEHDDTCDPENCFKAQIRAMREGSGMHLLTPKFLGAGAVSFYDSTIKEARDKLVSEAAKNGWEARPKHPLYDR
jgi:hypothetical protein